MSGTVSHLVGIEAHVARRVQAQVLLLPPMIGVEVALGMGKPIPFEAGRAFGACPFDSRRYCQFCLERTANGEAIRPEPGGSREE